MITVQVRRRAGKVSGFSVRGHAGEAPRGRDIVCAAVSALTQAAVAGLEEHLGLRPAVRMEEGRLECELPPGDEDDPRVQAILATMLLGLQGVAAGRPHRVRITEVPAPGPGREDGGAGGDDAGDGR